MGGGCGCRYEGDGEYVGNCRGTLAHEQLKKAESRKQVEVNCFIENSFAALLRPLHSSNQLQLQHLSNPRHSLSERTTTTPPFELCFKLCFKLCYCMSNVCLMLPFGSYLTTLLTSPFSSPQTLSPPDEHPCMQAFSRCSLIKLTSRTNLPIAMSAFSTSTKTTLHQMSDTDKYLFDLNGYIVVKNVFTKQEIAKANEVVSSHMDTSKERNDDAVRNTARNTPLAGDGKSGRIDLGGMLGWTEPGSEMFRNVLDHEKLVPYFHELLGFGYRMDHMPFIIAQNKGSEGFSLHGGVIDVSSGDYNHFLSYSCAQGVIRNNLLACSVVLSDHVAGSGGYCVVRGSHKSNFKAPQEMINGQNHTEFVYQPVTCAGDVVLFSEGTVHGALPWNMDHQRRVCLYRFAPSTCCYGRSYMEEGEVGYNKGWPKDIYENMSETQKAVLLPPYANRLDRLTLDGEGGVQVSSRSEAKKAFDVQVFGTKYF